MKKQIIALVLCAATVFFVSVPTKADVALDYANNQNNMQNAWLNQQWNYYNTYQQPVLNVYGQVITNQYSQGLAAQYQALSMQQMMLDKARADAFQIAANRFAHTTNMMTQMGNSVNEVMYQTTNAMDAATYAAMDAALKSAIYGMGQYPFPQVQ